MPISVKAPGREFPLTGNDNRHMYPWDELSVGDWFFVPSRDEGNRSDIQIQGKIGQLIRIRNANGDRCKYMHMRFDHGGVSGVKVMRIK